MKIHTITHIEYEGIGSISSWIKKNSFQHSSTRIYNGESLPSTEDYDLLIIMGGPMSVNDELVHPWLMEEKRHIEKAILDGKKILGICLGAQLIANVLGSKVHSNNHKEIGWFPILRKNSNINPFSSIFPEKFTSLHWHGETFGLPAGANLLISSDACVNQAFSFGNNVLALQFHLEMTSDSLQIMTYNAGTEIFPDTYIQSTEEILRNNQYYESNNLLLEKLLERLISS